jgi:hypothetical protein
MGCNASRVTLSAPSHKCNSSTLLSSTLSSMSFARIAGLQPRILAAVARQTQPNILVSRRLLSSSSRTHAEHTSDGGLQSNLDEKVNRARARAHTTPTYDAHDLTIDPYRNGPSAIDKAVHLFFFTEIIRGIPSVNSKGFLALNVIRNVGCAGKLLPSSLYHHVPVREGPSITPFPW